MRSGATEAQQERADMAAMHAVNQNKHPTKR